MCIRDSVEAAWPDRRIGVLGADQAGVSADGWDLRPASGWTDDELFDACLLYTSRCV